MDMKNKEQLLYFFLQNKISLSQYDYKFMANLQTMIQNQNRVTSNQADLFDKLISKYKKQLTKNGFVKEELKSLPWKTPIVESTSEFTGASVSLVDDLITIRIPFNKSFISEFRNVANNNFEWNKDTKKYVAPFSTMQLKIAYSVLPKFFNSVMYDRELQNLIDELKSYKGLVWNPTLRRVGNKLVIAAINPVLGEIVKDIELSLSPITFFELSKLHIAVDPSLVKHDPKLKFATTRVCEVEFSDIENVLSWMQELGCENVIIGRGMRNIIATDKIEPLIKKYNMNVVGSSTYKLPTGTSMLLQHTSHVDSRTMFDGSLDKTIVIKDSRPIEVK